MRLLILGGTAWLGGCVADAAVSSGHDVTCLARGSSGRVVPAGSGSRPAPDGARMVRADRDADGAYDAVAGDVWDAVVDVARQPGHVRRAVSALGDRTRHWVLVSSGSVYAEHATPGADERARLLTPLAGDVMRSAEDYGPAKVACEGHVLRGIGPERCLIARAGLIGGPGDHTGRTGYWPWRFAHPADPGGDVLVPAVPDLLTQVVDVRDLAGWLVRAAAARVAGVVDAVGERVPLAEHLRTAREVAGHTGRLVPAGQEWLLDRGVQPWMGERSLPLWVPLPELAGLGARDGSAARAAGLTTRPLGGTLADALAWEESTGPDRAGRAGLVDADERELVRQAREAPPGGHA